MDILIKAAQLFLSFTILVGIHEFGHFIMARIFKIRVEKFYIFFDPWFSLFKFKKGGTEYGLGWLPLGGYVKIAGMVDESMDKEQLAQPVQPDEFRAKPAWQRFLVMIAGVVMNALLAIVIYIGVCYTWGDQYIANEDLKWGYNVNATAEAWGFEDGDKIVSIDGVELDNIADIIPQLLIADQDKVVEINRAGAVQSITVPLAEITRARQEKLFADIFVPRTPFIVDSVATATSAALLRGDQIVGVNGEYHFDFVNLRKSLHDAKGTTAMVNVVRDNDSLALEIPVSEEGLIGVIAQNQLTPRTHEYTFLEAIPAGVERTGAMIKSYWSQLSMIVKPETKMYKELGGFLAIGNMFGSAWNWLDFWLKTAFISIMLGVLNLMPIPALDGGHALITLYEMITRRKPSEKFVEGAQYVGIILLLALMLYANGNDIVRLFTK